ncbi:hypothetical protein [Vibrio scophthalmi]|uniref:Uncharacterized protein n=1 Tax=Vibrio scophthalmi TaxID=45658 RepID=A0A1E3WFK3_9VIBR|nr:hypothetical protein [Vibrio scophthalmi]ODS04566.1 hypothetical protein VSF3289_03705 [Vibrio scophthalmi]
MTETGKILSELKKAKRGRERLIGYVHKFASLNGLNPKSVGLYVFPNGHAIEDRYPTEKAEKEFERIAQMYHNGIDLFDE